MYNVQELATAAKYGIGVVTVVFNDDAYGNVARDLDEAWGGSIGAELHNPDFLKLADAFGIAGQRAKSPAELGELVRAAIDRDRPALIEMPVGRMPRPWIFPPRRPPK
jgi:acetolactate synthase-1/2/3 large subunit